MLTNEILFNIVPELRTKIERCPILTNDVEFMDVYMRALAVKDSLIASVGFLKEVRKKVRIIFTFVHISFFLFVYLFVFVYLFILFRSQGEINRNVLVLKLESCLLGLPYHRHQELINHAINLISSIYQRSSSQGETRSKSKNILLSMLSCEDVKVRRESYKCCCEVLKRALKYSHVTNPMSNHYTGVLFMIDRDVIYIVSAFGLADSDEVVS